MSRENMLTYTVILHPEVDQYCVTIPEVGLAWGTTAEAALSMATKLIGTRLRDGNAAPEPTAFADVTAPTGDTKTVVRVDATAYQQEKTKVAKSRVTLPSYLNALRQHAGINFFESLTMRLKKRFGD